jgi:hypothetical protein
MNKLPTTEDELDQAFARFEQELSKHAGSANELEMWLTLLSVNIKPDDVPAHLVRKFHSLQRAAVAIE